MKPPITPMTTEDFIDRLADGDSNDTEIAGLQRALSAAAHRIPDEERAAFYAELQEIHDNPETF